MTFLIDVSQSLSLNVPDIYICVHDFIVPWGLFPAQKGPVNHYWLYYGSAL